MNKRQMLNSLNELIQGHYRAKMELIMLFERARIRHFQQIMEGKKTKEEGLVSLKTLLLIGKSGTGKTYLVEKTASLFQLPVYKLDATQLTMTSASGGKKLEDIIKSIDKFSREYHQQNYLLFPSFEGVKNQLIVFIDEFDKLGMDGSEGWNSRVQTNFLTLFERKIKGLENVSFIFSGAFMFSDLYEKRNARSIGFFQSEGPHSDFYKKLTPKTTGLLPEILGRINCFACLDELSKEDYKSILLTKLLPIKNKELLNLTGDGLILEETTVDRIADEAYNSDEGIRHMVRALDYLSLEVEFQSDNYSQILL